jgi:transposase
MARTRSREISDEFWALVELLLAKTRRNPEQIYKRNPDFIPRRWVVECFHSWSNRFRKLIPRYEKTNLSYLGLLHLAIAMIILNKVMIIYG